MGGSIKVNCLPKGDKPGLRGGVGKRKRRATAVVGFTTVMVEEVEELSEDTVRTKVGEVE